MACDGECGLIVNRRCVSTAESPGKAGLEVKKIHADADQVTYAKSDDNSRCVSKHSYSRMKAAK